ncbi:MAG: tetratricopeptide repeat protein [Sediminibacterium sp.]
MRRMLKPLLAVFFFLLLTVAGAQDLQVQLKEADNLEKQLKERDALEKYKQILVTAPVNMKSLVKVSELNVLLGEKEKDKKTRKLYFETALGFAKRALDADMNSADANYAMAMASGKMTDAEPENKKIVAFVKDVKVYSDKALALNPNHAKANYTLGKWHYEMVTLSGIKKMAVKLFYGGLPDGDLEKAIQYMEKCRSLEPYFVPNYLDLGKAYKENHQPAKAIEVLAKLVKLPTRTSADSEQKAEGAKLLESLQ